MSAKPRCGDYVLHCIAGCGFAVPRISYGHDAPFPLIVSPLFIRRAYGLVSFLTASSGTQCLLVRQRVHTARAVPVNSCFASVTTPLFLSPTQYLSSVLPRKHVVLDVLGCRIPLLVGTLTETLGL